MNKLGQPRKIKIRQGKKVQIISIVSGSLKFILNPLTKKIFKKKEEIKINKENKTNKLQS
jgi:predicted DNA-binding antitoxin AbrB/MazE fold protein